MSEHRAARIGILAGGGRLPVLIADEIVARGGQVHIVALEGEADRDLGAHPVTRLGWGKIGGMIAALRRARCEDMLIVGAVKRPDLKAVRPDLGLLLNLPAIVRVVTGGGDDGVLRAVVRFFESKGFRVLGPKDVAPGLIVGEGPLGALAPAAEAERDIAIGLQIVRALARADVGQGVVVARGRIEAIEGVEGTDAMLARVAAFRRVRADGIDGRCGVLVKRPKPGQEMRVDMPVIGPQTARRAAEARLEGIAVLADEVLTIDRAELVALADAARVFVTGVRDEAAASVPGPSSANAPHAGLRVLGRNAPGARGTADAMRGAAVVAALRAWGAGLAVATIARHVLAVEAGEGVRAVADRVAGLRQWGSRTRKGALTVANAADLDPDLAARAAQAGLSVLAIVDGPTQPHGLLREAIALADRDGLAVVSVDTRGAGGRHHDAS